MEERRMSRATVSIIAGTAIGGGILALPAVTAPMGYAPAAAGLVAVWAFLALNAVAFVEAAGLAIAEAQASGALVAVSHASVIQRALGPRLALLGGLAFCAQKPSSRSLLSASSVRSVRHESRW